MPCERGVDGALLVDKPKGLTSAQVVAILRKRFGIDKIGHAGTLDPLATGLLVVLCGRAVRLQELVMGGEKGYSGIIRLGVVTDTDDVTGSPLATDGKLSQLQTDDLDGVAAKLAAGFLGEQEQVPPDYSAIKVAGERSYKLARQGRKNELKARAIFIRSLQLRFLDPTHLAYELYCSKGTYVRALARDIGVVLGTGGCLEEIRRIQSAPFTLSLARTLDQLETRSQLLEHLVPIPALVSSLRRFILSSAEAERVRLGDQSLLARLDAPQSPEPFALLVDADGEPVSLLESHLDRWRIRFVV